MKSALALVLCSLTVFTHLPAASAAEGEKWALVVGVSKFSDPTLSCPYGAKNARDFAAYLVKEAGFKPDHVKTLIDAAATKKDVMLALGDSFLPRMVGPKDMAVIYISTEATPTSTDVGGINYLCAYDANKNNLFASGIALQNLGDIIKPRIPADRLITIIDSSYSGAEARSLFGDRPRTATSPIFITIAAAQGDQISQAAKVGGNSVFTKFLLFGLRKDRNIKAAFDYTAAEVAREVSAERNVQQQPSIKLSPGGDDVSL